MTDSKQSVSGGIAGSSVHPLVCFFCSLWTAELLGNMNQERRDLLKGTSDRLTTVNVPVKFTKKHLIWHKIHAAKSNKPIWAIFRHIYGHIYGVDTKHDLQHQIVGDEGAFQSWSLEKVHCFFQGHTTRVFILGYMNISDMKNGSFDNNIGTSKDETLLYF